MYFLADIRRFVDVFCKLAAPKDAGELTKINLGKLRQTNPKPDDTDPREFYEDLKEQALEGPIFQRDVIEYIENMHERFFPKKNRKQFTKWLANVLQGGQRWPNQNELMSIVDYLNAVDVNFDAISFDELKELSENWHTEEFEVKIETGSYSTKNVVYDFGNGYTIVRVPPEDLGVEGEKMGHCVENYCEYVNEGFGEIFSLRDAKNEPHVTIRTYLENVVRPRVDYEVVTFDDVAGMTKEEADSYTKEVHDENKQKEREAYERARHAATIVDEIKGKENKAPTEKYAKMVREWLGITFNESAYVNTHDYRFIMPENEILKLLERSSGRALIDLVPYFESKLIAIAQTGGEGKDQALRYLAKDFGERVHDHHSPPLWLRNAPDLQMDFFRALNPSDLIYMRLNATKEDPEVPNDLLFEAADKAIGAWRKNEPLENFGGLDGSDAWVILRSLPEEVRNPIIQKYNVDYIGMMRQYEPWEWEKQATEEEITEYHEEQEMANEKRRKRLEQLKQLTV